MCSDMILQNRSLSPSLQGLSHFTRKHIGLVSSHQVLRSLLSSPCASSCFLSVPLGHGHPELNGSLCVHPDAMVVELFASVIYVFHMNACFITGPLPFFSQLYHSISFSFSLKNTDPENKIQPHVTAFGFLQDSK